MLVSPLGADQDEERAEARGYYLVGEAPNEAIADRPDLWLLPDDSGRNHAANRLLRYSGYRDAAEFLAVFPWRTNLWAVPGRRWTCDGRRRVEEIRAEAIAGGALGIVLLGSAVATCYGLDPDCARFRWHARKPPVAVVHHPSGRNAAWNAPDALDAARKFFADLKTAALRRTG